jgi:hypothetical protein
MMIRINLDWLQVAIFGDDIDLLVLNYLKFEKRLLKHFTILFCVINKLLRDII